MSSRIQLHKFALKAGWASVLGLAATVPAAAGGPAVSEPNLSIITAGAFQDKNYFGTDTFAAVGVKGAIPLGNSFGLQGDAAVGTNGYYGVGGHLFARDPGMGLLGGFASHERNSAGYITRYGAEGALYMNQFTFDGLAGYQDASDGKGFVGRLDISYYATPNLKFTGGVEADPVATFGRAALEWQPDNWAHGGVSFFAEGRFGNANRNRLMVGANFQLGGATKSLIDRDRKADPVYLLLNVPNAAPVFENPPKGGKF